MRQSPLLVAALAMGSSLVLGQSGCGDNDVIEQCLETYTDFEDCTPNYTDIRNFPCFCDAFMTLASCYAIYCTGGLPSNQMAASIHYCSPTNMAAATTAVVHLTAATTAIVHSTAATTAAVRSTAAITAVVPSISAPASVVRTTPATAGLVATTADSVAQQTSGSTSPGGLSKTAAIGIGVGVGIGGAVAIAGIMFCLVKARVFSSSGAAKGGRLSSGAGDAGMAVSGDKPVAGKAGFYGCEPTAEATNYTLPPAYDPSGPKARAGATGHRPTGNEFTSQSEVFLTGAEAGNFNTPGNPAAPIRADIANSTAPGNPAAPPGTAFSTYSGPPPAFPAPPPPNIAYYVFPTASAAPAPASVQASTRRKPVGSPPSSPSGPLSPLQSHPYTPLNKQRELDSEAKLATPEVFYQGSGWVSPETPSASRQVTGAPPHMAVSPLSEPETANLEGGYLAHGGLPPEGVGHDQYGQQRP